MIAACANPRLHAVLSRATEMIAENLSRVTESKCVTLACSGQKFVSKVSCSHVTEVYVENLSRMTEKLKKIQSYD